MASYIDSSLTRGETIEHRAVVSWWSQSLMIILGVLTLFLGIGIAFLVIAAVRVLTTELAITNKRVIAKTGFIRRSTVELLTTKVESIGVDQSIFGRIFNYGSVIVRGTGGVGTPIPYIKNPLDFRRMVNEVLESE